MTRRPLLRAALLALFLLLPFVADAAGIPAVTVSTAPNGGQQYSLTLQILLLMTAVTLLPGIVLMMTAFTRIVIVLAILRQALGAGQVIAVTGGKGGVGKTSVAVNLATALGSTGKRVMLLDGDLGLANVDVFLGLSPGHTMAHVICGERTLEEIIVESQYGVSVVPGASGIAELANLPSCVHLQLVQAFSALTARVDTLIVDTAAGIAHSVLQFTQAAQHVLLVVCDEPASMTDAYALAKVLSRNHGVTRQCDAGRAQCESTRRAGDSRREWQARRRLCRGERAERRGAAGRADCFASTGYDGGFAGQAGYAAGCGAAAVRVRLEAESCYHARMHVLETDRLILRRLTLNDAEFIYRLVNDPSWLRFIGDKNVHDLDGARRYLREGPLDMYERFGFGMYRVEERGTGLPAGMCGLIKRDTLPDVDVGYAFLPEFRGKGYALEAASAVLDHGHRVFGLKRILAIVSPDNAGSIRVLEKAGMKFERALELRPGDPVKLFEWVPGEKNRGN
jgi:RimJ/RimL family protein N-acetyltransferase/Mrp family chromosome partitioning ATPase